MNKLGTSDVLPRTQMPGAAPNQGTATRCGAALPQELRSRLIERMRDAQVPEGICQAMHLSVITGRKYQTTRRWIDPFAPGLPDLASFHALCTGMDGDPAWLLGFVKERRSLKQLVSAAHAAVQPAQIGEEWTAHLVHQIGRHMIGCRALRMRGDEMQPDIADGDTVFVDVDKAEFLGNGIYLVSFNDHECVRRLEYRVGTGLVLACADARYAETKVREGTDSIGHRLKILGRVEGVVQLRRFGSAPCATGCSGQPQTV